jgi:hypothetical protein
MMKEECVAIFKQFEKCVHISTSAKIILLNHFASFNVTKHNIKAVRSSEFDNHKAYEERQLISQHRAEIINLVFKYKALRNGVEATLLSDTTIGRDDKRNLKRRLKNRSESIKAGKKLDEKPVGYLNYDEIMRCVIQNAKTAKGMPVNDVLSKARK